MIIIEQVRDIDKLVQNEMVMGVQKKIDGEYIGEVELKDLLLFIYKGLWRGTVFSQGVGGILCY